MIPHFGAQELLIVLALVLVLFGAKKVPEMARGLGQGLKEFKKATRDFPRGGGRQRAQTGEVEPAGLSGHRHASRLNEEMLLSFAISDALVLILRPDQQDFQGTAVAVDVAQKLQVPEMRLVVNKVMPSMDFVGLRGQVEQTYGVPVAGIFPLSEEMLQLGSAGVFCLQYPDHPFTDPVPQVAGQILA